ncbi:MAG: hypothetical protein FJ299_07045 [Planctomycetes bacterium]|nr:hypothetical protein [Planctomycetota bacterium]
MNTRVLSSVRVLRSFAVLLLLALLGCSREPEAEPPAASSVSTPASASPAAAAPTAPPPATETGSNPLLVAGDDETGDPQAPRQIVRGTLAMPAGAALPPDVRVVGLRRVWLPGIAKLRSGTWKRAPRAPLDADGRFELSVPAEWKTLTLYADSAVLRDDPLLHVPALPPTDAPFALVKPCAALAGRLVPLTTDCLGSAEEERGILRVRGAFGEQVQDLAPGAEFEFTRLPNGEELVLTLEAAGYAPLSMALELGSAERRQIPALGTPLERLRVRVLDESGRAVAGARVGSQEHGLISAADGSVCMPLHAPNLALRVEPPTGSTLLPVEARANATGAAESVLVLPAPRRLALRLTDEQGRALDGALVRWAPVEAAFTAAGYPRAAAIAVRSKSDGRVEIDGLYPAAYTIESWSGASIERGGLRATATLEPGPEEIPIVLRAVPSSRIELSILTNQRNPWPERRGRFVDVEATASGLLDTHVGNGTRGELLLPHGHWRVRVYDEKPGGPSAELLLELPRDAGRVHEFVLTR